MSQKIAAAMVEDISVVIEQVDPVLQVTIVRLKQSRPDDTRTTVDDAIGAQVQIVIITAVAVAGKVRAGIVIMIEILVPNVVEITIATTQGTIIAVKIATSIRLLYSGVSSRTYPP